MVSGLRVLLVALLCAASSAAQAQTGRQIFVDVSTSAGGAVTDLKPSDFQITEAGEVRDVSSAELKRRPVRIVLLVDTTDAIRQPIGQIRTAIATFLESVDAQHEMMFVTVSGTAQIRVQPTGDRQAMIKAARDLFGTTGANTMRRTIDDMFHRFGQTTTHRPIFVVVTAEAFESTDNINPQEIKHLSDHFISRGGTLHGIRLIGPLIQQRDPGGNLTDLPVTLMIARDTGGAYTDTSPNGLLEVLQRLAGVVNDAHHASPLSYQLEYAGGATKNKKSPAPGVRVNRDGVNVKVISTP